MVCASATKRWRLRGCRRRQPVFATFTNETKLHLDQIRTSQTLSRSRELGCVSTTHDLHLANLRSGHRCKRSEESPVTCFVLSLFVHGSTSRFSSASLPRSSLCQVRCNRLHPNSRSCMSRSRLASLDMQFSDDTFDRDMSRSHMV